MTVAFTGYFKTERNPSAPIVNGWQWLDTTINQIPDIIQYQCNGSIHYRRELLGNTEIYCHDDAAPEPVTDGLISSGPFVGSEVVYSGPIGILHSFTSAGSFFSFDQGLDVDGDWTIYYNAKATGVDSGYTAFIIFAFYKRDTNNNDTHLWSHTVRAIGGLYSPTGYTVATSPTGTVTTNDRLRIRVTMGQEAA